MRHVLLNCLPLAIMGWFFSAAASEYEVEGKITQVITQENMSPQRSTNDFAVFVRDCGWLIQTIENDGRGNVVRRQIGSTNGMETVELAVTLKSSDPSGDSNGDSAAPPDSSEEPDGFARPWANAIIRSSALPVGNLDISLYGHLWLLFASQCYFKNLNATVLTPVYDWHATVGVNPGIKMPATWELWGGPGSLPREVRYLGEWDETNGLYIATGSEEVGGVLIPNGFIFEERHAFQQEMVLRKRVEAKVTTIRPVCSKKKLLPETEGYVVVTDFRPFGTMPFANGSKGPNRFQDAQHFHTYSTDFRGQWPSVDAARKLVETARSHNGSGPNQPYRNGVSSAVLVCALLLVPLIVYFIWKKAGKVSRKS